MVHGALVGQAVGRVRLAYRDAPRALVEELVAEAWASRAPKRLLDAFEGF